MSITQTGVEFESETYQPASRTHRFEYDQETTDASLAVVAVLSEVLDVDPIALDPLQKTVDTDALDTLVAAGRQTDDVLSVSFTAADQMVTVHNDGTVVVAVGEETHTEPLEEGPTTDDN
jgi:thiamine pyrophosphokinase